MYPFRIKDVTSILQYTIYLCAFYKSKTLRYYSSTLFSYLSSLAPCTAAFMRPVHTLIFSPSLLITRAYGQCYYVESGSTCDSCVPLIYLYWSSALLVNFYSCVQFMYLYFRRLYLSLVRTVNIVMLEAALLVICAYSKCICIGLRLYLWLVLCFISLTGLIYISDIVSGCIAIGVFSCLCFILPRCFLYSSCTAGLSVLRSCSEKLPCGIRAARLYQFSDV